MFESIKKFFKATIIYGFIGSIKSFIEFLLLPIYARFLSPSDFGRLDILMVFLMAGIAFAILELHNAVFRFYFDDDSLKYRRKVINTAVLSTVLSGFIIFLLILAFSKQIAALALDSPDYGHLFILTGVFLFLNSIVTVPTILLRIENRPIAFTLVSLLQIAASLIGIVVFVIVFKWGIAGILIAKTVSIVVALPVYLYLGRKYWSLSFDFRLLKSMLKFSLPMVPAGAALWGINTLSRSFMLQYLSFEQIGLFSIATKFVIIITLFILAFQLAWPQFAFFNMNAGESKAMFGQVFNIFAAAGLWLVILLTLFAGAFIKIAMTPEFYPSVKAILPLSLGMFGYGLFYFFTTGVVISKSTFKIVPSLVAAIIINIIFNIILTPRYGFVGTAWAMALSYAGMALVMLILSLKFQQITFDLKKLIRLIIPAAGLIILAAWLAEFDGGYMLIAKTLIFLAFPVILAGTGFIDRVYFNSIKRIFKPNNKQSPPKEKECVELRVD